MEDHEIDRTEGEGGNAHQDDQATEIERLKGILRNPGGGVPLPGHEERAVHAILAMATVLRGSLDDLMWGSECPKPLDRLLRLMQDIIGAIRGTTIIPAEENVALLLERCEEAILEMQGARLLNRERCQKLAESMTANPGDELRPVN